MFEMKWCIVSLAFTAALLSPTLSLAAVDADESSIGVELKLRKARLLPYEPLIGTLTVTNKSARAVPLSGYWSMSSVQYEGDGREGSLWISWLPSAAVGAFPTKLAADQQISTTVGGPTFGRDNALTLKPRTEYNVWTAVIISTAESLQTNRVAVSIEPIPEEEVAAVAALTTRKLDQDNSLLRALVGGVPRDAATFAAIRRFVAEFPDSTYSIYLRCTYLALASTYGPPLSKEDRAPVDEYAAHLKEHAEDLLAPLVPALEQAAARDKPPASKPARPSLKRATDEDAAAVRELVEAYYDAYTRGHADACLGMMTEDFRFGGPEGLSREGMREPIEEDAQENQKAGEKSRRITAEVTEVGLAENGEIEAKVRSKVHTKDGTLVVGPTNRLWRFRRVDGEWKVFSILTEEVPLE